MNESIFQHPLDAQQQSSSGGASQQGGNAKPQNRNTQGQYGRGASEPLNPPSLEETSRASSKPGPRGEKAPASAPAIPRYLNNGAFKTLTVTMFIRGLFSLIVSSLAILVGVLIAISSENRPAVLLTLLIGAIVFVPSLLSFILGLSAQQLRKGNAYAANSISSIITFYRVLLFILVGLIGTAFFVLTVVNFSLIPLLIAPIPILIIIFYARYLRGIKDMVRQISYDISTPTPTRYRPWINVTGFGWFFAVVALISSFSQAFSSVDGSAILSALNDLGLNLRRHMSSSDYRELMSLLSTSGISLFAALSAGWSFVLSVLIPICHRTLVRAHRGAAAAEANVRFVRPASASVPGVLVAALFCALALFSFSDTVNQHWNFSMYSFASVDWFFRVLDFVLALLFAVGLQIMCFSHLSGRSEAPMIVSLSFMLGRPTMYIVQFIRFYSALMNVDIAVRHLLPNLMQILCIVVLIICAIMGSIHKKRLPTAVRIIMPVLIAVFQIVILCMYPSSANVLFALTYLFSAMVIVNLRKMRAPADTIIC